MKVQSEVWKNHWLGMAQYHSRMSKDPSTRFGAIIVGDHNETIATGINGFPRGIKDDKRLYDRDMKYKLIVHAEENAIINAARLGVSTLKSTLFLFGTSLNLSGIPIAKVGFICSRCAGRIIQAGIKKVVMPNVKEIPERWQEDAELAFNILKEARVYVQQLEFKE